MSFGKHDNSHFITLTLFQNLLLLAEHLGHMSDSEQEVSRYSTSVFPDSHLHHLLGHKKQLNFSTGLHIIKGEWGINKIVQNFIFDPAPASWI